MTFSLTKYLVDKEHDDTYYQPGFMRMIESCLGQLRTQDVRPLQVSSMLAYKYEGDFYGLLLELNVSYNYLWIALRVNGMVNPSDYTVDVCPQPVMPSEALISTLYRYYTTTTK